MCCIDLMCMNATLMLAVNGLYMARVVPVFIQSTTACFTAIEGVAC